MSSILTVVADITAYTVYREILAPLNLAKWSEIAWINI